MTHTHFTTDDLSFRNSIHIDGYDEAADTVRDPIIIESEPISVIMLTPESTSDIAVAGGFRMKSKRARVRGIMEFVIISAIMYGTMYLIYRYN